jgi:hypothetical protein
LQLYADGGYQLRIRSLEGTPNYGPRQVVHRTLVRCARLVSGELATLGKTSAVYDYNSPDCLVVHWTVR